MFKKRFKIIYLPEGRSSKRELRFNYAKLTFFTILFVLTILLVISGLTLVGLSIVPDYRIRSLSRENRLLLEQIASAEEKLLLLQKEVQALASSDEELRILTDLPLIDEATRQAGVGGSLPIPGIDPSLDLDILLGQLDRQIEVQKKSYPEIIQKLEENLEIAVHTPAIAPVNKIRITSYFGWRKDPFTGKRTPHKGVDFGAPRGTEAFATADGVVIMCKRVPTFGKLIIIDHGYGYETVYGHLQSFRVMKGERVKRGQVIGVIGSTGRSTAPHLHYEVRVNKVQVDPLDYIFNESLAVVK